MGLLSHRKTSDKREQQEELLVQDTKSKVGTSIVSKLDAGYFLTRILFFRLLGMLYFVSFLIALQQNRALIGERGLLPFPRYLHRVKESMADDSLFLKHPTLLWWMPWTDTSLDILAWVGLIISSVLVLTGASNTLIMILLWQLTFSIVEVGQRFYSFGWESQLLETGFLACFVAPFVPPWRFSQSAGKVPHVAIWGYRWLLFRIMLGAGLIKIRGDTCWRELTCMDFHYETQPVPGPLSWYFHSNPPWFHVIEVAVNHFAELVAPLFLLCGRELRQFGGAIQFAFQGILILSGNLSYLNWLTALPAIWCFDDAALRRFFSAPKVSMAARALSRKESMMWTAARRVIMIALSLLLAWLSIPVIQNMASSRQVMNTSFNAWKLVNTYGAFGSITKERTEVIILGTDSENPNDPNANWREYEFFVKPGDVNRRPPWITPYHHRIDWLMWFAAFGNYQQHPQV